MLKQSEIDAYAQLGYLIVPDVFTPQEIAELNRVTDEFVESARGVTQHTDVFDLEPTHTPDHPRLRRIKTPPKHHPVYDASLRNRRVLDFVAQLVGPSVHWNGSKLNMKAAEYGSPVEWHQDWAFYPHTNDDLLAVGVALDDCTTENGCLVVIPGSHRGPVYDHHQDGTFAGGITDPSFDPKGAIPVEVAAGGISIHHTRLLHGSAPNESGRRRRLLLHQYCAGDAWPLMGHPGGWDGFAADFLRGAPTPEPRLAAVPVRLPLPPALRGGSIYETQTLLHSKRFSREVAVQ